MLKRLTFSRRNADLSSSGKNPNRHEFDKQAEELGGHLLDWLKKNNSKPYDGVKERELI